jgi:ABC-type cobalamin/Fe3+-siderophores transport system ATPase subunit
MNAAIHGHGLAVAYGSRKVFAGVHITLEAGLLTALVGPNGAGKSSLLRVLAGIQRPQSGAVERPARVALIATSLALPPDVTPAQLSGYVLALRRPWWRLAPSQPEREAVAAALARAGLLDRADDAAAALSAGEIQRAWIAAALAADAGVLLIDEPTTHLDLRYQLEVLRMLKTLSRSGVAVLAAIHDLTLAARFADSVALLAGGALEHGRPEDVFEAATLTRAFGVDVVTHRDPEGYVICTPR